METFIPSTPPPVANPTPACGQGNPAVSQDAAESPVGLFGQILRDASAAQSSGNGNPADATTEGQGGISREDDSGAVDPASVESATPVVLPAVVPPAFAAVTVAAADAGGTAAPEGPSPAVSAGPGTAPPAGALPSADLPAEIDPAVASTLPQEASLASAAPKSSASGVPAGDGKAEVSKTRAAMVSAVGAATPGSVEGPVEVAPVDAAPVDALAAEAPPAEGGPAPAASRGVDAPPSASAAVRTNVPAADRFAAQAAAYSAAAAKEPGTAPSEGSSAPVDGEPETARVDSPSAPARDAKPQVALSGADGKSPMNSRDGDAEPFSSAWKPGSEAVDTAEPSRKEKAGTAFRMEEPADPAASPAIAADRGAADKASPIRHAVAETTAGPEPKSLQVGENAFVLTRKSDTSIEVTLSPPGMGKLEIEVVLEKGIVNARITAADPAGRDAIERSLPQIIETLSRDGMAIGGFTVSLKQRKDPAGDPQAGKGSGNASARPAPIETVRAAAAPAGLVDLFV